jgi:hypothetical protein
MTGAKSTRRQALAGLGAAAAVWCCGDHLVDGFASAAQAPHTDPSPTAGRGPLVEVAAGLSIHRRSDWGADLPPMRAMPHEDVRFLLVHHSATSNDVPDPRSLIRGIYAFHTSSAKRWPDVAYNFFVAPDGSVWEGRAGSIDGPVAADATGGNQGYAQLVCLLGNHVEVPPTAAAQTSLTRTLAWMAGRFSLNTYADASTTFVSRGSNKFPAGQTITTPIVSAHRDVTYTACPGDAAVALLPEWRRRVHNKLAATWEIDGLQRADRVRFRAP